MYIKTDEIILKTREELGEAAENAWSIGAYNEPIEPVYIGSCKTEHNTYHYFMDIDGTYYFEDEVTMKFDKELKEHQKKTKKNKPLAAN